MGVTAPFLARPARAVERVRLAPRVAVGATGRLLPRRGRCLLAGRGGAAMGGRAGSAVPARGGRALLAAAAVAVATRRGEEQQRHERDDQQAVHDSGNSYLLLPHVVSLPSRSNFHLPGRFGERTEPDGRRRGPV